VSRHRFLFIATNIWVPWGGSEFLWAYTCEKLARAGHEVRVSVLDWGRPIPQFEALRSVGCRILYRRQPRIPYRIARTFLRLREPRESHLQLAAKDTELIIISQGGTSDGLEWMESALSSHCPYVVVVQSAAHSWWPGDGMAERLAKAYDGAIRAYFVSSANLELCRRQFGSDLHNARVIRNPFNVRYDARPAWPDGDQLSVACVARLEPVQKGQDVLLELLSLKAWRDRDAHVTFVGGGTSARGLEKLKHTLKLQNVEFLGEVNDIEEVWRKHHALVLPSHYEGLPLALVEAMLCGRPAIVTDAGGNRELVRDGVNGFLAKAATVELLGEALNRAWECRSQLGKMGEQAAIDARQFVGPDPAGDFARELESLLGA
jgi:glycosyltransferase involved in cell wall biosynthesis